MKFRGFLVVVILSVAVVYFLWVAKAGKDKVIEEVRAFSESKLQLTQANMANLAKEIQTFQAMQGRAPGNIKEVQMLRRVPLGILDNWGTAIKYEKQSDEDFRLISAGPDRTFSTEDDIIKEY
jgi:hypothetical protein